jgi:hypothetical protein
VRRLQLLNPLAPKPPRTPARTVARAGARAITTDTDVDDLAPMPDRAIDYAAWLVWQKRRWRRQRAARLQLRADLGCVGMMMSCVFDDASVCRLLGKASKSANGAIAARAPTLPTDKLSVLARQHPQLLHTVRVVCGVCGGDRDARSGT